MSIAGQALGSVSTGCKPGKHLLSTGFDSPSFNPAADSAPVRVTVRRSGKAGARGLAYNFAGSAGSFYLYAYCGLGREPVIARSETAAIEPQAIGGATARCPAGTEAISGGFDAGAFDAVLGPRVIALTSMREGTDSWQVQAGNFPGGSGQDAPGQITAYAYCQRLKRKLVVRSAEVATTVNGELQATTIRCPDGLKPISGGFDGHPAIDSNGLTAAGPITARRTDRGTAWLTVATNAGDPNPGLLTAYAYCRGPLE